MGQREREVLLDKLLDVGPLDIVRLLELNNAQNLYACQQSSIIAYGRALVSYVDGPETGTVPGSHVGVERLNGGHSRGLTVLLVHVVGA